MLAVPVPPPARMAPRRAILFIALVCLCAALVSGPATAQEEVPSPTPSVTSAATLCGPRVRRGWATLTTPEKQLYLDAVMKAMSTGLHTLFHEVHTDNDSGSEAHLTCGMIYWHRRFLLAYENMLRSLEPRFACLTIPYWDYFADFAKRSAGYCTSLEGCSTFLMELGGSIGPVETCTLGGNTITSNCVTSGLPSGTTITFTNITHSYNYTVETHFNMSGFCESSAMTPANCSRCVPRGNWTTAAFPSGFGYGTLARAVSASFGFQTFAQSLHYGVHNSIHNAAGSTMATLSTSADPIFYNFHAMGDLSHQLWYDCQVKRPMTEYEKKNSNYAYATCSQSTSVTAPSRLANITQYWSSNGTNRIRADDHPVLGKFFAPLPIEYWQFVSGTDLGDYSYSYANDGMLHYDAYMKVLDQMALMECAWYVEQGGFIVDWTDDFKRNMKMPADAHSPEYMLIMKLISGELKIELDNWRDIFKAYLQVDGTTQTTKLSPSGVKQPLGLEAVLDTSSASSISPGSLTEEAGVFIENQGTSATDTGIVMIPATLLEDV